MSIVGRHRPSKKPTAAVGFFDGRWLGIPDQGIPNFPPAELAEIIPFSVVPTYMDEAFLRQKYVSEGLSTGQIADLISSARSTVTRHLKRYGIPIRPAGEVRGTRKGQVAFGRRAKGNGVVTHQREAATIEKMLALRSQGYSYWKIAEVLNAMKVPTKNRRGRWHPTTVMKILGARSQA